MLPSLANSAAYPKCGMDIFGLKGRITDQKLFVVNARRDNIQNHRHHDSRATDARFPMTNPGSILIRSL